MELSGVTKEMLAVLEHGAAETRKQVATDPSATEKVLMRALGDEDWIREVAAANPAADEAVLMKAVGGRDWRVQEAAAGNPAATERVLMRALDVGGLRLRAIAAGNVAASEAVLMRALGDGRWLVQKAAASHPRLSVDLAKVLLKSSDDELVAVLAQNEALPERIRVAARLKAGL